MVNKTWECRLCTNWNEGSDHQCQVCGVDRPQPTPKLGSKLRDKLESIASTGATMIQKQQEDDNSSRKERLLETKIPKQKSENAVTKTPYEPPSQRENGGKSSKRMSERSNTVSRDKRRGSSSKMASDERPTSSRRLKQEYHRGGSSRRNVDEGRVDRVSSRAKPESYSSSSSSDDDDYDDSTSSDSSSNSDDSSILNDGTPANEEERLERLKGILIPQWGKKYNYPKHFTRLLVNLKFAQLKRREMYGTERPWGILGLYEHLSAIRTDIKWSEEVEERHHYEQP